MGFLNKIFGKKNLDNRLEGVWLSDVTDHATQQSIGDVSMSFTNKGDLFYDIKDNGKLQRMIMIYWTDGDILCSDQPSHPKQEKTKYSFESDNTLVLDFEGQITRFKKTTSTYL